MASIKEIDQKIKEHGLFHVLFFIHVALMATLGANKKFFWFTTLMGFLVLPFCLFLGYSEFSNKLHAAGLAEGQPELNKILGLILLHTYYTALAFPYIFSFHLFYILITQSWSNRFWIQVDQVRKI